MPRGPGLRPGRSPEEAPGDPRRQRLPHHHPPAGLGSPHPVEGKSHATLATHVRERTVLPVQVVDNSVRRHLDLVADAHHEAPCDSQTPDRPTAHTEEDSGRQEDQGGANPTGTRIGLGNCQGFHSWIIGLGFALAHAYGKREECTDETNDPTFYADILRFKSAAQTFPRNRNISLL